MLIQEEDIKEFINNYTVIVTGDLSQFEGEDIGVVVEDESHTGRFVDTDGSLSVLELVTRETH